MEGIVATTTNGANVIKSFERMICCVHQLCLAYGTYHLAVSDFLYARQNLFDGLEEEMESNNTGSDSEFSSEKEVEDFDEAAVDLVKTETIGVDLQWFVAEVIGKVRTVMKMFRKTLQNEILQKHIQAQLNTELKLIVGSKTRWNSHLEMIKIFVRTKKCSLSEEFF